MDTFLTLLASLLAAGFSGLLAIKAFCNLKPYALFRPINTLIIRNTNKDRDVMIAAIINPTNRQDIEISNINFKHTVQEENFSQRVMRKPLLQNSKIPLNMLLVPNQEVEIEFKISAPGIWVVVERDSFNFIDQLPVFNVVIRDKDPFKLRDNLADIWHKYRKYYIASK